MGDIDSSVILEAARGSWGRFREHQQLGGMGRDAFSHFVLETFCDPTVKLQAITGQSRKLELAVAALRPFAKMGEMANFAFAPALFSDSETINDLPWSEDGKEVTITFGDVRKARTALQEITDGRD